eukprot:550174_1
MMLLYSLILVLWLYSTEGADKYVYGLYGHGGRYVYRHEAKSNWDGIYPLYYFVADGSFLDATDGNTIMDDLRSNFNGGGGEHSPIATVTPHVAPAQIIPKKTSLLTSKCYNYIMIPFINHYPAIHPHYTVAVAAAANTGVWRHIYNTAGVYQNRVNIAGTEGINAWNTYNIHSPFRLGTLQRCSGYTEKPGPVFWIACREHITAPIDCDRKSACAAEPMARRFCCKPSGTPSETTGKCQTAACGVGQVELLPLAAHQELYNFQQNYYDLLAGYEYDVAVEQARENKAHKLLRQEKRSVLRAKNKIKRKYSKYY